MSDLIEALRTAGKGEFLCPSCGSLASDTYEFPFCPRGCSVVQTEAATAARPAECPEHFIPTRSCLRCRLLEKWTDREASRMLADTSTAYTLPESVNLADLLAEPDEPTPFLVEGLWPVDGHVVLSGPAKAGKTTLRNNLIRSLVDGKPFLGMFDVAEPVRSFGIRVAIVPTRVSKSRDR